MKGYLAVTHPSWFEYLSRSPGPRDANFWRPSTRSVNLPVGTPFLFKLKAPHNAIGGFGYFAGYSILPDWLAWDTFDEANGAESLEAMRKVIRDLRKKDHIEPDTDGAIGCRMIAEARFFPRDSWIPQPVDWAKSQLSGMYYDLEQGEGRRVWQECLARASSASASPMPADPVIQPMKDPSRYAKPALYQPRLGQGIFRVQVLDAYGRTCAVTHEHSLPVLEAAHILPYAKGGPHDVANGLALRSDVHRLFDKGYVTIDSSHRFVVGDRLKADFENGRIYYEMRGNAVVLPKDPSRRPSPQALAWHRDVVFRG